MSDKEPTQEPIQQEPIEGTTLAPEIVEENNTLSKLPVNELIDIIRETRSEAKTRRLKARELEEQMSEFSKQQKLNEQLGLEKKQEFETLYSGLKEETKDYEELKQFKNSYLETCKDKIESSKKSLSSADLELFELSSANQSYDNQLKIIEKILTTRKGSSTIDTTQTTHRTTGQTYTKNELLADTALMAEVKENNPTLYNKYFGKLI